MRKAIIENGLITNVIEVSDDSMLQPDWAQDLPDAGNAGPGWTWDGKDFQPPPDPPPVIDRGAMSLTFPQLLIGLVAEGWVTEPEATDWLNGTPPPAAMALIDTLPPEAQFAARVRLVRPTVVLRLDPLVQSLAAAEGRSDDEVDTFFATYAAI